MTSHQASGVLLLLTFFAGAALAGDGAGEPGASGAVEFKSRAARDAAARYAATVERLNLDHQDKLADDVKAQYEEFKKNDPTSRAVVTTEASASRGRSSRGAIASNRSSARAVTQRSGTRTIY